MTSECDICWTMIAQAAQGARDQELLQLVHECEPRAAVQLSWFKSRLKQAAPQALVVAQ